MYIYIFKSIACTVRPEHTNILCNSTALLPLLQKHTKLHVEKAGSVKGKKLILRVLEGNILIGLQMNKKQTCIVLSPVRCGIICCC